MSDIVPVRGSDWVLRLSRDRFDLCLVKDTQIVARHADEPGDAALVVVALNGEHVLRRPPVTEGEVVGFVLGRLEEISDGA